MRMTIFNVRLSREDEAELAAAAKKSGRSKSEIARDAISAHLKNMADDERRWETLQDDWSEYGSAVQDAYEALVGVQVAKLDTVRSEEHTSELQSLMRISYAVFCLKKKKKKKDKRIINNKSLDEDKEYVSSCN